MPACAGSGVVDVAGYWADDVVQWVSRVAVTGAGLVKGRRHGGGAVMAARVVMGGKRLWEGEYGCALSLRHFSVPPSRRLLVPADSPRAAESVGHRSR